MFDQRLVPPSQFLLYYSKHPRAVYRPRIHYIALFVVHCLLYYLSLALGVSMGLLKNLKGIFSSKPNTEDDEPSPYPPIVIDWEKFEPAGVADARSPCPMINALCNHHILPHNGKNITRTMANEALSRALNLDHTTANMFSSHAVRMNPDTTANNFSLHHLAKHGDIEHNGSLSRSDAAFGDNHTYNAEIWDKVVSTYGSDQLTSFESVSKARYERIKASQKAHEDAGMPFTYGIKELILSHGESALLLSLLGDPENGQIPVKYLKVLFEEARVPYKEGWRKSSRPITQKDMIYLIMSIWEANEEKLEEAETVQMGTVTAVEAAIGNMVPSFCSVM